MHSVKVSDFADIKVSCKDCSLLELCLPRGLGKEEMKQLDNIIQRSKPLHHGESLFRIGHSFNSLYVVRAGSVKTYIPTQSGNDQILGFHLSGELLGLDALEKDVHTCTAVALETTMICEFPFCHFEQICQQLPELYHQMYKLMSKEISNDHRMLLLLGKKSAEERLATFLLNLSNRFKKRGFSAKEFNLSMSRHDIANYLGLAVETVSRLFSRFQEEGLVSVQRRHVYIHDLGRLGTLVRGYSRSCSSMRWPPG